jgi:hypothetical protein
MTGLRVAASIALGALLSFTASSAEHAAPSTRRAPILAPVTFRVPAIDVARDEPTDEPALPGETAPPASADAAAEGPMAWPPALLGDAGPSTHDPALLFERAGALRDAGLDVVVLAKRLSTDELTAALALPSGSQAVVPVERGGEPVGLVLYGFHRASLPRSIGLENGDVVTAVNGFAVARPEDAEAAYESVRRGGVAIVEATRGAQRVIVRLEITGSGVKAAAPRARKV